MTRIQVALDSNLLLLLVVGMTAKELIGKHKRLRAFMADDYDLLMDQLSVAAEIVVTPNTLSETSNLIDYISDPARSAIYGRLRALLNVASTRESYVGSSVAAARSELPRLGLTDCALLELSTQGTPLITVDLHLYLAAQAQGGKAINFNHLRSELR